MDRKSVLPPAAWLGR